MKILNIKPTLQNPKLSYCSLNAVKSILDFYLPKRVTRDSINKILKTHPTRGTDPNNITKTLTQFGLSFTIKSNLSFTDVCRSIDRGDVVLISYISDMNEAHSSIICGYDQRRGIQYVTLCDSLFGIYEMPFGPLRVLFKLDHGSEAIFIN